MFRSFQANLLSLISHELRTPLTGVLNALGALHDAEERGEPPPMAPRELLEMAWSNARKLSHQLAMVLDLASLESGSFHVRLQEVELDRVVRRALGRGPSPITPGPVQKGIPLLADPSRLARGIELLIGVCRSAAVSSDAIEVRVGSHELQLQLELREEHVKRWDEAWLLAAAGVRSGVTSPLSAFGGVVQSEQAFLTRTEEGLGSELLLVQEIAKLHGAELSQKRSGHQAAVRLALPVLDDEVGLKSILASRAYHVSSELGAVGLILVRVPPSTGGTPEQSLVKLRDALAAQLFRATDAVYALKQRGCVALVLDDCKPDAPAGMMVRLQKQLGLQLKWGAAHCPTDGLDPSALIELAAKKLT